MGEIKGLKGPNADISKLGFEASNTQYWNLSAEELTDITVEKGLGQKANSGALVVDTGEFTGRSPKDRFVVKDSITEGTVDWGNVNMPFEPSKFDQLWDKVINYLNDKELYIRDAAAGADPKYRLPLRVITELPWSNMFANNMFLRPSEEEIQSFEPEWHVIQAPGFHADPTVDGTRQHNFAIINFTKKCILIGGTGYTGEIKKGIFSVLNFVLPHNHNVLSMHCSANIGQDGDTALFFGLSGTGKTTLSADPNRGLIGDDEHG
jgi:phosphoenolpyruvate carboxykinase (ATP)